ncbi:MAG: prephenate dehydratase domain-containing protein [Saccharofermentanales bacterium]
MTSDKINGIEKLREEISDLDDKGAAYLSNRIGIAAQIGTHKKVNHLPVYDSNREQVVIGRMTRKFDPDLRERVASVMSCIMRVSREVQYDSVMDEDSNWEPGQTIGRAEDSLPVEPRICCQGTTGSYSHLAAASGFPDAACMPALTFEECMLRLSDGDCDIALLPLENTTAGTVNDVYDLLTRYPFYISKAITVPIHHKLVVLPGSNVHGLRTVLSHPQALAQCSSFIRSKGLEQIAVDNTAFAVNRLKEINDRAYCAIASGTAGSLNNLEIIEEDICDSEHNQTRFVAITREPVITPEANRVSIYFKLPHQSGSLANILSLIAERGLSLTKIQSRPVPEKPWEYSFWADVSASYRSREVLLMLYQLSKELPFVKFLGWYEELREPIEDHR